MTTSIKSAEEARDKLKELFDLVIKKKTFESDEELRQYIRPAFNVLSDVIDFLKDLPILDLLKKERESSE